MNVWFARTCKCALMVLSLASPARASGHGPVFAAATPTLGKSGWSFDQGWMGQVSDGPADAGSLLRSMIGFGITEKLQISASVPVPLGASPGLPTGRMMATMSGNRDVEALLGWRFHTRPAGHGARLESTAYVGALVPVDARRGGLVTSPAAYMSVTTGYASRSHYVWIGLSHQRNATRSMDRQSSVTSYSAVYGYRPPAWRTEYPRPDLRIFIEAVGDRTGHAVHNGRERPDTGGQIVLVGPTLLLLYKAYGLSGGVMFPVYQRTNGAHAGERLRFGVNLSYFFWPGKGKGH